MLAWMGAATTPWNELYEMDLKTAIESCRAELGRIVDLIEGRTDPEMTSEERFEHPVTQSWIRRSHRLDDRRHPTKAGPHPSAQIGALREATTIAGADNPACDGLWERLEQIANEAGDEATRDDARARRRGLKRAAKTQ